MTTTTESTWFRPYTANVENVPPRTAQQQSEERSGRGAGTTKAVRLARAYSTIPPTHIDYLWEDRIPLGEVTLIGGDRGIAKGRLMARLAADISNGWDMLDGTPGLMYPASVMLVTPEDDPNSSMSWRLAAHRASLDNVYDMTELPSGEFSLPGDIDKLRAEMLEIGNVKLVIIDPLSQVSEKSLTSGNSTVRKFIWGPLRKLARETGAAIVCVMHTVKSGDLQGSKGLQDAARVILMITRDKADPRIRRLSIWKANDADDSLPDVCYTLTGTRPYVRVEYIPPEDVPEDDGLSDGERRILRLIKDQPKDVQQIAEATQVKANAARVMMHRMNRKGLVERKGRGLYQASM
jgi:hypothetical protein